jgi:hypothetical protein
MQSSPTITIKPDLPIVAGSRILQPIGEMTMKRRLRIIQDTDAFNPRTEYDGHAGRMLCWHSRYNLGDEHSYDSDTWKRELIWGIEPDLEDKLERLENEVWEAIFYCLRDDGGMDSDDARKAADSRVNARIEELVDRCFDANYVALPLYLYDHSGITMNTGGFSCGWDSGCVGVIVCDRATVEKEFNGDEDRAEASLRAEVETYDHYLTGNCWGYVCEEFKGGGLWEEVDSCWGFLGNPENVASGLGDDWKDVEPQIEYA